MALNPRTSPPTSSPRHVSLTLFAVAVVVVASVSIGATAAYFELHPTTPSVGGSNTPVVVGTIPVGDQPGGIAYDPAQGEIFVANTGSDNVSVISDASDTVIATIPVGGQPDGLAYDANDSEIFVSIGNTHSVTVVSSTNYSFIASVAVGTSPLGIAYDPAAGEAFVANSDSGNVSVISNTSNAVVATIPVGRGPYGVAYDFATGGIFVANSLSNTTSVISVASNTTVATIPVGSSPSEVAYDAATSQILVTNSLSDNVSAISDTTNRTVAEFPVGLTPIAVIPDTAKGEFFVANENSNNVTAISDATGQVVTTLDVGNAPTGLAYDSAKGEIFVVNDVSNSVTVISDSANTAVRDDEGRTVTVPLDPQRIVVLGPNVMDMVYRLGLRPAVVGVGCTPSEAGGIYSEYTPSQIALWSLTNGSCVTDYPSLNTGDVALLGPQVVLASTIYSAQAIDQLSEVYGLPVVVFGPSSLSGIVTDVRIMAQIFPASLSRASSLEAALDDTLSNASALDARFSEEHVPSPTVLLTYYFDSGAYYTYGPGSFGDSLIALAGGVNIAATVPLLYAGLNATVVLNDQPLVILYGTSNDTYVVSGETPSDWSTAPYWGQLTGSKIPLDIAIVSESDPTMILALPLLMHWLYPTLVPLP